MGKATYTITKDHPDYIPSLKEKREARRKALGIIDIPKKRTVKPCQFTFKAPKRKPNEVKKIQGKITGKHLYRGFING